MKVLIAGGSGLVGNALTKSLIQAGHEVKWLSRKPGNDAMVWDPERTKIDPSALDWAEAVVNLAGAGIADERWSEARKSLIRTSRVMATRFLVNELNKKSEPKILINASAIGVYGNKPFEPALDETAQPGNDFLASVCKDWEAEAEKLIATHRLVIIRIGIVLSQQGGALLKLIPLAKWGIASAVGSGLQGMSWIHIHDLVEAFRFCIENPEIKGIVNGTGPVAVSNDQMMKSLSAAVGRPYWMPAVPSWVLRSMLGEMADVVLSGQHVIPAQLLKHGFEFRFPQLPQALNNLLCKPH